MPGPFDFSGGGFLQYNPEWNEYYWNPHGGGQRQTVPQGTQFPEGLEAHPINPESNRSLRDMGYDIYNNDSSGWDWGGNIQNMQGYYAPQNQEPAPAPQQAPVTNSPEISPRMAGVRRGLAVPEDQRQARLDELDNQAAREDRERWLARMTPEQRARVAADEERMRNARNAQRRTPEQIEQQSHAMADRLLGRLNRWGATPDVIPSPRVPVPENASPETQQAVEEENSQIAAGDIDRTEADEADPWGMAPVSARQREAEEAVTDPLFEYNEPFEKRHHDWDWNNVGDSIKNKWSDFIHNAKGSMSGMTPGELANMARREYSRYQMLGGLSPSGGILSRLGGYLTKRGALGAAEELYNRGESLTDNPLTHGVGDALEGFMKTGIGKNRSRLVRNVLGGAASGVERLAHNLFPTANDFWTAQNAGDIGSAVGSLISKRRLGRFGAMGLQALYDTLQRNQENERRNLLRQRRASNPNYRIPRRDDFRDNDPIVQNVFNEWDENRADYA
jgi:hypothetical protein